ncbi:TDP-N-acetylfucosamine:lipid II N-acetylfucosaminyltransferase family protein [Vibrio rotiferianus]|uniref:TDP-N-acetylfucosamine:lipid II N-acetylfucosaminyltransferase n=1 Tax=Vibrio rotiferianus TaxID=190895 RepID=UPI00289450AA|nr:putative 4-alpha-L-fucosyltransferase [Vibrio rotiferianus]
MIIHIFENIPHHYHNFMQFFANYSCDGRFPDISRHKVYIQTSGDPDSDKQNHQQLEAIGVQSVVIYPDHAQLLSQLNGEPQNTQFIFHSLLSRWLWLRLFLSPVSARSHWVSWGADLYQHILTKATLKQKIAKWIQSITCRRMLSVKCLNPGDADLLSTTLHRSTVGVLPYPLVGVSVPDTLSQFGAVKVKLLLGNSAAPSNNHFELIDSVAALNDQRVEVHMPLNYAGSEAYVAEVIRYGEERLGRAFNPITEMLTKERYDELLASVDGAVFAHDRQQGLYVAYYMMLHGKKLFLKASTSTYDNFVSYGFRVESLEELANQPYQTLATFSDEERFANQSILSHHFTEKALGPKWGEFFRKIASDPIDEACK